MELTLLTARLVLAAVFGVAGAAKLADPTGSRRAMVGFGVPDWLAPTLARLLPLVELGIAVALIPLSSALWGASGAVILLLTFSTAIAGNLFRGKSPDCHCFGQLHSTPVTWATFARNMALAFVAGLILVEGRSRPGPSALSWLSKLTTAEVVSLFLSGVTVTLVATGVVYLKRALRQQSTLMEKVDGMKKLIEEDYAETGPVYRNDGAPPEEGLPVGAPAPPFSLNAVGGGEVSLQTLLSPGSPVLLLFVSPNCTPCKTILPLVSEWEQQYGERVSIAVLSKGSEKNNRGWKAEYGLNRVLLQGESGVSQDYESKWTPAAVLVGSDGRVASPVTYGDEAIRALVVRAATADTSPRRNGKVRGENERPKPIIGTPMVFDQVGNGIPEVELRDMDGETVILSTLVDRDTLLLFWDPGCSFCRAMSEDIVTWEREPPDDAPQLIFVASGRPDSVRADSGRFRSQFLYDANMDCAFLFGTDRTPTAVLIADGRIASAPTAGRSNIMALAGVRKGEVPMTSRLGSARVM